MGTVDDVAKDYDIDVDGLDDDEKHDVVMEYLKENTSVVGECEDGIIFAVF